MVTEGRKQFHQSVERLYEYNFLLLLVETVFILYRVIFQNIASYLSNVINFSYSRYIWCLTGGDWNFKKIFGVIKLDSVCYRTTLFAW